MNAINTYLYSKLPVNELFQFSEIKPKVYRNLDEMKAKGLDDIGISFFKLGMCVMTEPVIQCMGTVSFMEHFRNVSPNILK